MIFLATSLLLLGAAASNLEAAVVDSKIPPPLNITNVRLNFTTNITNVEDNKPFRASCHVENLADHAHLNYTISFYRTNRLDKQQYSASYKLTVKPNGVQSSVFDSFSPDGYFSAAPGAHFAYPDFDVILRSYSGEVVGLLKNYWCELTVDNASSSSAHQTQLNTTVVSNIWVQTPITRLTFSGPSDAQNTTFTASCQVHFLERSILKGAEYQVKLLLADSKRIFPISYNDYKELAVFKVPTVAGNAPLMFLRNDSYLGRSAVMAGPNDALPTFDFVYRAWGTGNKKDYFVCRVENVASRWKEVSSDRCLHL